LWFASDVPSLQIKRPSIVSVNPILRPFLRFRALREYDEGIKLLRELVGWGPLSALKTHAKLLITKKMYDKVIAECDEALSHPVDWCRKEHKSHLWWSDDFKSTVLYYKANVLNAGGNCDRI